MVSPQWHRLEPRLEEGISAPATLMRLAAGAGREAQERTSIVQRLLRYDLDDLGRREIAIVDNDRRGTLGVAFQEIQFLPIHVAAVLRSIHVGGAAIPPSATGDRHVKGRIEENAEVPVASKLRAVQEDAIEQQDRVRPRVLGRGFYVRVRTVAEHHGS